MTHSRELRDRALSLYKSGLSCRLVAKEIGVNPSTVHDWCTASNSNRSLLQAVRLSWSIGRMKAWNAGTTGLMPTPWNKGTTGVMQAWNKGKPWPEDVRKKVSDSKRRNPTRYWLGKQRPDVAGENCWRWRGGKSLFRGSGWHTISKRIRERDNWTCQRCHNSGVRLAVHHIIPYRVGGSNSASNLTTLCQSCHAELECILQKLLNGIGMV